MRKQAIRKTVLVIAHLILLTMSFSSFADFRNADLIYGDDDRYEINDYFDNDFIEKSRSVAIRVSARRLSEDQNNSSMLNFPLRKLKTIIPNICPTERFTDQFQLGDCSGFLVAPNKLVTAGHCMASESECLTHKWVFDFNEDTTQLKKSNVYSCKKILNQKNIYNKHEVNDYAVIELDRPALERKALSYRKMGQVPINTPLLIIGYPLGLPVKITDGGRVSRMNENERENTLRSLILRANYFTTNIDAYHGNSGSPVFNKKTGKVEGILVQGTDDFVFNQNTLCLDSQHLSDSYLTAFEKVMRITKVPGL